MLRIRRVNLQGRRRMALVKWFLQSIGQSWFKLYIITSCLEVWLSSPYISAVSAQDGIITCSVPPVHLLQDTVLTCHFPEDISVTKKDFTVYHYNKGVDSDAVVDCWWMSGNMECVVLPGYAYNMTVNTELSVTLTNVTSTHTGTYACQVAGYPPDSFVTCQLHAIHVNRSSETTLPWEETSQSGSESFKPFVIGLSVGLTTTILIVGLLFVFKRKRIMRFCMRGQRKSSKDGGVTNSLLIPSDLYLEQKTKEFEEYLETRSKEMYPNILKTFYFVPPVYFNKTECRVQHVADQTVYIHTCPDRKDAVHDQAMQQIILSLRQLGEQEMFVLTQFSFDDYLNNPCQDYVEHRLPMPAGSTEYDKDIECFHFLIIHRHKGVLVGMVKVTNDTHDESQFNTQKEDEIMVEVPQDIERLENACRVVKHLMSDQPDFPEIRKILILFNVTWSIEHRLKHFEDKNITFCHCRLPDADTCWTVDSRLAEQLSMLLSSKPHETIDDVRMTDNVYLKMISRFCGPATTSTFLVPFDSESYILPKTLDQAVSLAGNFFERLTVYPGMTELLEEPQVCLAGPPCTGKTKMLALVGRKWLSEGHDVHIMCSSLESAISRQLTKILKTTLESQSSNEGNVILIPCDNEGEEGVRKAVSSLKQRSREKPVLLIIDEIPFQNLGLKGALHRLTDKVMDKMNHDYSNMNSKLRRFGRAKNPLDVFRLEAEAFLSLPKVAVEMLAVTPLVLTSNATEDKDRIPSVLQSPHDSSSGIHVWVAGCCFSKTSVTARYFKKVFFENPLSCPPAVLREMFAKNKSFCVKSYSYNRYPPPTDGPPVLHIHHEGPGHPEKTRPSDCITCGKQIERFFTNVLRLTGSQQSIVMMEPKASLENVKSKRESPPLQFSDLLLLFENAIDNETPMVKILVTVGIPVLVINHENQLDALVLKKNTAVAANAGLLWGIKRKVVVFVEGMERGDSSDWIKLRGITSCTSQLVLVHMPADFCALNRPHMMHPLVGRLWAS